MTLLQWTRLALLVRVSLVATRTVASMMRSDTTSSPVRDPMRTRCSYGSSASTSSMVGVGTGQSNGMRTRNMTSPTG